MCMMGEKGWQKGGRDWNPIALGAAQVGVMLHREARISGHHDIHLCSPLFPHQ